MNNIPFAVYEAAQARADRRLKWLWMLTVIIFIALIGTNAGWIYYESQYQDEVTTIEATQDDSNGNIVLGGDINYGTEGEGNNDTESP